MSAKGNGSLSAKERALIEAARQSIAAKRTPTAPGSQVPASTSGPASEQPMMQSAAQPPAQAPAPATHDTPATRIAPPPVIGSAEHIALLMQAEREQSEERKRKLRRWGIHVPLGFLILLVLWTTAPSLRQVFF